MVLAIGHALRAHEALSRPDALPDFLEVLQRLFEYGVFVSHDLSIRTVSSDGLTGRGILRGVPALRFATTTGGMLVCRPPGAASKHTSVRTETYFKGTTTEIDNA